jgi:hypothetical protein
MGRDDITGVTTTITNDNDAAWDVATAAVARDLVGSVVPNGGDASRQNTTTHQGNNVVR